MKRLIICSMFILFSSFVIAKEEPTKLELCKGFADYAKIVMEAHQAGAALADVLKVMDPSGLPEALAELMEEIVVNAYKAPRYSTAEYKRKTVAEYRDRVHVSCLTNFSN